MNKQDITSIKQLLSTPKKIVIVPHKNPDGDAIGSTLGLYHYLIKGQHEVNVLVPNDYPKFLKWIPGNDTILKHDTQSKACNDLINDADIIFTLDFNAFHRTGNMETILTESNAIKIMIDHHLNPQDFASIMVSETSACSTAQLIVELIDQSGHGDLLDEKIGTPLYLGILTDTGSFRFPSVQARTHELLAKLLAAGVQHHLVHEALNDNNTESRLRLQGYALSKKLEILYANQVAIISLTKEELEALQAKLDKQQADIDAQSADFSERQKALDAQEAKQRRSAITSQITALVDAGKILPAEQQGLTDFAANLSAEQVVEFGEGDDGKEGAGKWLFKFLEGLPKRVDFGEHSGDHDKSGDDKELTSEQLAAKIVAFRETDEGKNLSGSQVSAIILKQHEASQ